METLNWFPVYYNGLETNIEVSKYGDVRKVNVAWTKYKTKVGIVDFSKLKLHPKGYKQLTIQIKGLKGKNVCVQQLIASAFMNYKFDGNKTVVDHKREPKTNNSIDNLQLITQRQNLSKERTEKSGLPTGVHFYKQTKKYKAEITIDGKQKFLGYFETIEQASNAYRAALFQDKQHLRMVLFELGMFSVPRQLNNNELTTTY